MKSSSDRTEIVNRYGRMKSASGRSRPATTKFLMARIKEPVAEPHQTQELVAQPDFHLAQ